jgi:hypothetical protein
MLTIQATMFLTLELEIRYVQCNPLLLVMSTDKIFQWFKFNDHNVTLASKSQVLNEQAFLLFYVIQSLA